MDDLISRQAAIRKLQDKGEEPMYQHTDEDWKCGLFMAEDIITDLPTFSAAGQWIPVSEKLPTPNSVYEAAAVYYLVQNEYGDMMVATFVKFPGGARIWQQMYQGGAIMEDIVAWMPLPEPWRGEEDDSM